MILEQNTSIIIQSHRGAHNLVPENTLGAFIAAWERGAVPEADVRTTRDGTIIAFHDEGIARMVPQAPPELKERPLRDLSWIDLAAFDLGAGQRVARLVDIFATMRGHPERNIYLDLKEANLARLAQSVQDADVGPQVILASSDPKTIQAWIRQVPDGRTLHWMGGDDACLEERFKALRQEGFSGVSQLQIHIAPAWEKPGQRRDPASIQRGSRDPFINSDAFLRAVAVELERRKILFQVLPWEGTGDRPEVYWKLLDLGARSFATDYLAVALRAIADYQPLIL